MSLEQRINEDMKAAMKSGDKTKLDTIRLLRAAIIEFNKSGTGATMSEDDEQTILNREAKKRREALELYRQSNRPELIEKGEQE
ncbi:MAG: GatB/YqeY domain-containing protein, partial [Candidatus Kapaibacterium sp.]